MLVIHFICCKIHMINYDLRPGYYTCCHLIHFPAICFLNKSQLSTSHQRNFTRFFTKNGSHFNKFNNVAVNENHPNLRANTPNISFTRTPFNHIHCLHIFHYKLSAIKVFIFFQTNLTNVY